jgi:hypothetical protein
MHGFMRTCPGKRTCFTRGFNPSFPAPPFPGQLFSSPGLSCMGLLDESTTKRSEHRKKEMLVPDVFFVGRVAFNV